MDDTAVPGLDLGAVASVDEVEAALAADGYLADRGLATVVYLALRLRRPLLLEGDAGVGKTELARTLARVGGGHLIRLQCHEGIDAAQAVYEWDYARQLLHLRTAEAVGELADRDSSSVEAELFDERFLLRRPVLESLAAAGPPAPVLLVDEIDRADDEFEAFLLEVLSDYAVTVPELGTFRAVVPPVVVLTSNRTRELHDALKRRCLYHWVDHPTVEREAAIVIARAPTVDLAMARAVARLAHALRDMGLNKPPGVSETIDWASALALLEADVEDGEALSATLGTVLKYREDEARVRSQGMDALLAAAHRVEPAPLP